MGANCSMDHFRDVLIQHIYPRLHPVEQFACSLVMSGAPRPNAPLRTRVTECGVIVSYMGVLAAKHSTDILCLGDSLPAFEEWAASYQDYLERSSVRPDRGIIYYNRDQVKLRETEDISVRNASPYRPQNMYRAEVPDYDVLDKYVLTYERVEGIPELNYFRNDMIPFLRVISKSFALALIKEAGSSISSALIAHSPHWEELADLAIERGAIDKMLYGWGIDCLPAPRFAYILRRIEIDDRAVRSICDKYTRGDLRDLLTLLFELCPDNDQYEFMLDEKAPLEDYRTLISILGDDRSAAQIISLAGHYKRSNRMRMSGAYISLHGLPHFLERFAEHPSIIIESAAHLMSADDINYDYLRGKYWLVYHVVTMDRVDIFRRLVETKGYSPARLLVDAAIRKNAVKCLAFLAELREWEVDIGDYADVRLNADVIGLVTLMSRH